MVIWKIEIQFFYVYVLIDNFPPEIWYLIANFMDIFTLIQLSMVNKVMYDNLRPIRKMKYKECKARFEKALISISKLSDKKLLLVDMIESLYEADDLYSLTKMYRINYNKIGSYIWYTLLHALQKKKEHHVLWLLKTGIDRNITDILIYEAIEKENLTFLNYVYEHKIKLHKILSYAILCKHNHILEWLDEIEFDKKEQVIKAINEYLNNSHNWQPIVEKLQKIVNNDPIVFSSILTSKD